MNINVHEVSSKMVNITAAYKGYKQMLRDALALILRKEDGAWLWSSFAYDMPEGKTKVYEYSTFREYLKKWSQFDFEDLKRLFNDDAEMLVLLDKADIGERGGQEGNQNASKDVIKTKPDNISIRSGEHGTGKAYTLRRLEKDAPDLFNAVVGGDLSANAAAIQAGFRRVPTAREKLMKAWNSANQEDRDWFLKEVQ